MLAAYLIGFADGAAAHARELARAGFDAYSGFPQVPLRVFFISLVFRPAGLLLIIVFGAFVLATAPSMLRVTRIIVGSLSSKTGSKYPR